jgi:hypothetical protein
MRTTLLIAALVAVTACEGQPRQESRPTLGQIEQECGYGRRQFVEAWPCVRVGFAGSAADSDLLGMYLATGDYIAEQMRDGKMTETEARMAMSEAVVRASTEANRRAQSQQAINAQRTAAMAGVIAATRPQPVVMQPVQQPAYRAPVFCNRYGNQVVCQ